MFSAFKPPVLVFQIGSLAASIAYETGPSQTSRSGPTACPTRWSSGTQSNNAHVLMKTVPADASVRWISAAAFSDWEIKNRGRFIQMFGSRESVTSKSTYSYSVPQAFFWFNISTILAEPSINCHSMHANGGFRGDDWLPGLFTHTDPNCMGAQDRAWLRWLPRVVVLRCYGVEGRSISERIRRQ